MTQEEYYQALKEKHARTDWSNLDEVRMYNEFARTLRSLMELEDNFNND